MGGKGTFIQLFGTEGRWGCYVVEVPAARRAQCRSATCTRRSWSWSKAAAPPRSGPTDRRSRSRFEWQTRLDVLDPAQHQSPHRQCGVEPGADPRRHDGAERDEPLPRHRLDFQLSGRRSRRASTAARISSSPMTTSCGDPLRGLAMRKSNFIPDIFNAELYLDNRRSPGYKRVEPSMANNVFYGFVGEHQTGHYSKAHAHMSAGDARLHQRQGLHLHVAARRRHDAVEGRQDRTRSTARITSRSASSPRRLMAATGSTRISASARSRCA